MKGRLTRKPLNVLKDGMHNELVATLEPFLAILGPETERYGQVDAKYLDMNYF
ncbi:hypothetical protein J6590_014130 [Homalodisca vitripennis]|nr:hypothetical protein J6590_014130 [Homalodisca vitripennis]